MPCSLRSTLTGRVVPLALLALSMPLAPVDVGHASAASEQGTTVTLSGMVLAADGSPLDAGSVAFGNREGFGPIKDGRFEFRATKVRPGVHLLSYHSNDGSVVTGQLLSVEPDQREAVVSLQIGREPVLEGRVLASGLSHTVSGAVIYLRGELSGAGQHSALIYASKDGTFSLDGRAFQGFSFQMHAPHCLPSDWVEIRPPFPMQIDIALRPEAVVSGVVSTESGAPIADARVYAVSADMRSIAVAAADGRFQVAGLTPGSYNIAACAKFAVSSGVTLSVKEGEHVGGVAIRLPPAPVRTIRGRVVGPDGRTGVPEAEVSVDLPIVPPPPPGATRPLSPRRLKSRFTYSARTNESGQYQLQFPRPGEGERKVLRLAVRGEGYLPRYYLVAVLDDQCESFDLQLFRGGRLAGTVVAAKGSSVPADTVVELEIETLRLGNTGSAKGLSSPAAEASEATGRFDFGLVLPGEHNLFVRIDGQRILVEKVKVREGEATQVELRLPSGGVLSR